MGTPNSQAIIYFSIFFSFLKNYPFYYALVCFFSFCAQTLQFDHFVTAVEAETSPLVTKMLVIKVGLSSFRKYLSMIPSSQFKRLKLTFCFY